MKHIDTAFSHARTRMLARHGFNLVEAAIVLGVVGLVIGGVWVAASAITTNRQINDAISGVLLTHQRLSTFKGPGSALDTFSFPKSAWPSIMAETFISAGSSPTSPWGKSMVIGTNGQFSQIYFEDMPISICATLGPKLASATKTYSRSVGYAINTMIEGLPISSPSEASTNCAQEYENNGQVGITLFIPF